MEKERRKAYDFLVQTINESTGSSAQAEQKRRQLQLQLLRDIESQTPGVPYGVNVVTQLSLLLAALPAENETLWLLWLNELLLCRKQQKLLGELQPLLETLLQRFELQQEEPAQVVTLRCLLTLLESNAVIGVKAQLTLPRLTKIKLPSNVEVALLLLLCQVSLYDALPAPAELQLGSQLGQALLNAHYDGCWSRQPTTLTSQEQQLLLALHSLELLQKITMQDAIYAQQQAPELLGLALAYVRCGADVDQHQTLLLLVPPHRVQPAQQAASSYSQDEEHDLSNKNAAASAAGRRVKSRKMRSLTKQRNNNGNQLESNAPTKPIDRLQQLLLATPSGGDSEATTSDSAAGITAAATQPQAKQQRQTQVKLRLAALQLLSAVTKQLPRRMLYGYWHALFPSDGVQDKHHLLHLGANDGNVRCRALALQLAAQLLYGSKPYLSQASCISPPTNYTPFALSLANSVLLSYQLLTSILQREYAPPVLTQCLKSLAVLVQATPFDQLTMGFVYEFVPHVKKLARHVDISVKVSALLVMEMLVATPRLTPEMSCAVGLPRLNTRDEQQEQYQPQFLCEDSEEEEPELELEEQPQTLSLPCPSIPRNSWLLRLVVRYLDSPGSVATAPLRIECLQVILAMCTHFHMLRDHLARLAQLLAQALEDPSMDVRLYAARCLDAVGFQLARLGLEQTQHLTFWMRLLPAIYGAYIDAATPTLKAAFCDALSNMGVNSFERLPQPQRNGLLAFLLGCSSDDAADTLLRAAALRALAVYVLHPTLREDLVFVEHAAELTLRLSSDPQLAVRIKAAWALGNISDALIAVEPTEEDEQQQQEQEHISQSLLSRLIEAAVRGCSDHDKVRANAVRALGNLLRLLPAQEQALLQFALPKLLDCLRAAGSAKVKWNACYALGNLVKNRSLFSTSGSLVGTLYDTLGQLIVQHANFKVRINATSVLLQIEQRADFATYFAVIWRSLLEAIERSNALDTFEEYNHRDGLQQQLCLAIAHMLARARPDDLLNCRSALEAHLDVVNATWRRVACRIVPEQAAPLFTCGSLLQQSLNSNSLNAEQRNALKFIADALRLES